MHLPKGFNLWPFTRTSFLKSLTFPHCFLDLDDLITLQFNFLNNKYHNGNCTMLQKTLQLPIWIHSSRQCTFSFIISQILPRFQYKRERSKEKILLQRTQEIKQILKESWNLQFPIDYVHLLTTLNKLKNMYFQCFYS